MIRRRRFKQTTSLEDRLVVDARKKREQASGLPPGKVRDNLLETAQAEEALAGWATSSALQRPG